MVTPQLAFGSDVRQRIYRYVERHGAATREEVREAVRIADPAESKPARSGTVPSVRLPVGEFDDHVAVLIDEGYLVERDGRLSVDLDVESEHHEADAFAYEVRPAREDDREAVADRIREVAAEGAIVVDERVADAIGRDPSERSESDPLSREGGLVRRNERESRVVFVAERADDETDEIVGWVLLQGCELPARDHTVELTAGVAPEYREQGIGGTLLERGIAWADERDYLKVYQSLPATNEEALELLADHGWEREATRADHYKVEGELVDEVQVAKRLDE